MRDQNAKTCVPAVESDSEEAKSPEVKDFSKWNCPLCTFINPIAKSACEICYAPRPPTEGKKTAQTVSSDSNQMFLKMTGLYALAHYFKSRQKLTAEPIVAGFVKQKLQKEILSLDPVKKILLVGNLPRCFYLSPRFFEKI